MFTGIIEEKAKIKEIKRVPPVISLRINANCSRSLKVGDSVAVEGVCLTVVEAKNDSFLVEAVPETVKNTTLSELRPGAVVNIERALPVDGRFSGHIVTGHVDGAGIIRRKMDKGDIFDLEIGFPEALSNLIVAKGSIAVDGVSLTISKVYKESFMVSIIPHTARVTTLAGRRIGDPVNLEADIIGKYVVKQFEQRSGKKAIDQEYLKSVGLMK
ncbi:MAG: riboflavin synthase [Candidatus Saganbacteria bacterium]|nr:riboflavin synthase [Candidatus Saganbacteria bacterium]